jgi:hypothetical protein
LILAIYTEEIYVADGATLLRIDPIGLRDSLGTAPRQCQSDPPRTEAADSDEGAARRDREDGREDGNAAGRQRCPSILMTRSPPCAAGSRIFAASCFEAPHFRSKITPRLSSDFRGGRCGSEISGGAVRRCRAVCWTGHAGQFRKAPQFQSDVDSLPFG